MKEFDNDFKKLIDQLSDTVAKIYMHQQQPQTVGSSVVPSKNRFNFTERTKQKYGYKTNYETRLNTTKKTIDPKQAAKVAQLMLDNSDSIERK